MPILLKLALMFAKLCLFAFGGGYVMIPLALKELEDNHLASAGELADFVAIAQMSPGPVAVNAAVGLGYKIAGYWGALSAFLGMVVPNTIIILVVAVFFFKIYENPRVKAIFYGLKPATTGIILYAAAKIALKDEIVQISGYLFSKKEFLFIHLELKSILIAVIAFFILKMTKLHPIFLIVGSGLLGMLLF